MCFRETGYNDRSEILLEKYEDENFEEVLMELWEEVKPMYLELHAYVRRKLREHYGSKIVGKHTIPAHLLGKL